MNYLSRFVDQPVVFAEDDIHRLDLRPQSWHSRREIRRREARINLMLWIRRWHPDPLVKQRIKAALIAECYSGANISVWEGIITPYPPVDTEDQQERANRLRVGSSLAARLGLATAPTVNVRSIHA